MDTIARSGGAPIPLPRDLETIFSRRQPGKPIRSLGIGSDNGIRPYLESVQLNIRVSMPTGNRIGDIRRGSPESHGLHLALVQGIGCIPGQQLIAGIINL